MSLSLVQSHALLGLSAPAVTVEVHLVNGLPSFTLVGLADVEVKEARERVRSALINSGFVFPHNKRITVNLAPADLPKDSGRFDLPMALGILVASGQIDGTGLADYAFAGELSLSGELRPVRGALAMSLAVQAAGADRPLVLPMDSAQEAALVPGVEVYGAGHLLDVAAHFARPGTGANAGAGAGADQSAGARLDATDSADPKAHTDPSTRLPSMQRMQPRSPVCEVQYPCLSDVKGQVAAKRALEIAAAGGHSVLLVGPPGSGKSMLAQRFAGLLPPMQVQEALQSAAIANLAGRFAIERWGQRPLAQPHHSASAVALVGGGSPPRPGEISLAHEGVLFLDELPEFARSALEALREPLELGQITISRAARSTVFPARFQLIAAMNPCPCGYLGSRTRSCRCSPEQIARYQGKLSGPLLDRIDLQVEVPSLPPEELLQMGGGETTAALRARCQSARLRAEARQGCSNQALVGQALMQHVQLENEALRFLQSAAERLGWSARGMHRCLKIARTIADLALCESVHIGHVAEAVQYRRALKANA